MKKFFKLLSAAALLCLGAALSPSLTAPAPLAGAAGGRQAFDFNDPADFYRFDYYSEVVGNAPFFVQDGFLVATGQSEQKALLKSPDNLSAFTLSADFYPLGDTCPLGTGFYIYANNPDSGLDRINGYDVYLNRSAGGSTVTVRIHRYNQRHMGIIAEYSVPLKRLPINLKAEAASGRVKVYLFGDPAPALDVQLSPWTSGRVGLRCARGVGAKIGNFSLTAASVPADTAALAALIERAQGVGAGGYTENSAAALQTALPAAQAALSATDQNAVDAAAGVLAAALDGLIAARTFAELQTLIASAKETEDGGAGKYTANGFDSLKSVIRRAEALGAEAGEDALSEFYALLETTMGYLTPYGG